MKKNKIKEGQWNNEKRFLDLIVFSKVLYIYDYSFILLMEWMLF